jgi:hypothetical protein
LTWRPASINAADATVNWNYAWTPQTQGNIVVKVRGVDDSGNKEIPGPGIKITIGQDVCPCNIFPPGGLPIKALDNDKQSIEVGVKFKATENGFISGIRYYKGIGTTGTHVGSLWTSTGVSLGTATFTNETAAGWQEVLFSAPIAITAGVTYVASTFSPSGDYASTTHYFKQAVVNGPLRGLADGEDGFNGVFVYTNAPAFPTVDFMSINYWVDVVFTRTSGGAPPTVTLQPTDLALCQGGSATATFSSSAVGNPAPTAQWQSSADGINWTNIPGAVSTTLSFVPTTSDNNKLYRAVWTNPEGPVYSSSALLKVTAFPVAPVVTVVNNCGSSKLSVASATGSLLWSNGATTPSITVIAPGTFTVTETVNGCTGPAGSGSALPKTKAVLTSSLSVSVKSGDPLNYIPTSSKPGTVFTWSRAAVNGISNPAATGSGNISETLINTTNSPVKVKYEYMLDLNGCVTKQNVEVTVTPLQGGSGAACVNTTTIEHHFNSQRIEAGKYIWFVSTLENLGNSNFKNPDPATILVTNSQIVFWSFGKKYTLNVPDSRIQFTNDVNSATTAFINNVWVTKVPLWFKDEVFMGGLSYKVPVTIPGNIKDIQWTADVSIDKPGVSLKWAWGAAVYSKFANHPGLFVKPVSGPRLNQYRNSDEAGTPENYKPYLVTGGTSKNHWRKYTGEQSGKKVIKCRGKDGDDDHDDHQWPPFTSIPTPHNPSNQSLNVFVNPNPSSNSFVLKIETKSKDPITVTITDNFGLVVGRYERINALGVLRFGDNLKTGLYFVEIKQGDLRRTITVLKVR